MTATMHHAIDFVQQLTKTPMPKSPPSGEFISPVDRVPSKPSTSNQPVYPERPPLDGWMDLPDLAHTGGIEWPTSPPSFANKNDSPEPVPDGRARRMFNAFKQF